MSKCEPAYFLIVNYLLKVCLCIYYKIPYNTEKLLGSIATNEERLRHTNNKQTGAERENGKGLSQDTAYGAHCKVSFREEDVSLCHYDQYLCKGKNLFIPLLKLRSQFNFKNMIFFFQMKH